MHTLKTTAAVTLALLLALTGTADAHSHRITGDDGGTPTTHPLDPGISDVPGGNDNAGPPSTHPHRGGGLSTNPQAIEVASLWCGFLLPDANSGFSGGAGIQNTSNVTIHAGSRIVFHFPGGDVVMVIPMDIAPQGQWAFLDGGDPNFSFPVGTVIPYNSACSFDLILA